MNTHGVPVWVVVVALTLIIPCTRQMVAQDGSNSIRDVKKSLVDVIESDRSKGEWVFYRQRYLDADKQWVQYHGSVYAAVQNMNLEKCQIDIETVIVDRFTGMVGKTASGQQ